VAWEAAVRGAPASAGSAIVRQWTEWGANPASILCDGFGRQRRDCDGPRAAPGARLQLDGEAEPKILVGRGAPTHAWRDGRRGGPCPGRHGAGLPTLSARQAG